MHAFSQFIKPKEPTTQSVWISIVHPS